MSAIKTYQHNGAWLTEIRIDNVSTFSRPATEHEISTVQEAPEPANLRGAVIAEAMTAAEPEEAPESADSANQDRPRRGRPPKARE